MCLERRVKFWNWGPKKKSKRKNTNGSRQLMHHNPSHCEHILIYKHVICPLFLGVEPFYVLFWKCGTAMKCSVGPRTSLPKLKENYKKLKKKPWGQRRSKTVGTTWSVEEERVPSPPPSLKYAAGLITWRAAPERRGGENTKGGACQSASNVTLRSSRVFFLSFVSIWMEIRFSIPSGTVFDSSNVLYLKEKVRTWEEKTNFRRNQKPFF